LSLQESDSSSTQKREKKFKKFGFCDEGLLKELLLLQRVCLDLL